MILEFTAKDLKGLKNSRLEWLYLLVKTYSRVHETERGHIWRFNLDRPLEDLSFLGDLIPFNTPDRGGDLLYDFLMRKIRDEKTTVEAIVEKLEGSGLGWALEVSKGVKYAMGKS